MRYIPRWCIGDKLVSWMDIYEATTKFKQTSEVNEHYDEVFDIDDDDLGWVEMLYDGYYND